MDSLSGKQAQKVVWVLRLIEEFEVVPSQYFKKMVNTKDLWEVRVSQASNIFRFSLLYGWRPVGGSLSCLSEENSKDSSTCHPIG